MKKVLSLALVAVMALSLFAFTSCGEEPDPTTATLKFGAGVVYSISDVENATAEKKGAATIGTTAAVVLLDDAGKIVKCAIDSLEVKAAWDNAGAVDAIGENALKTKYEKGDSYGMVTLGGATKEWYQQIDALIATITGKTMDEVKAMVVNGKGNDDIINAGCTIYVTDFVAALEKACANAAASNATADATVKLGFAATPEIEAATADKNASIGLDTTVVATAIEGGKVVAAKTDCTQASIGVSATGECASQEIASKYEKGDSYGMVSLGGAQKEWFEQADAFSAQLIGKNATEIASLVASNGKGNDAVVSAGCTIYVTDLVKAAIKAATV